MRIVAIDPSIVSCGVAVFEDKNLVAATCIKGDSDTSEDILTRCITMADEVRSWLWSLTAPYKTDVLVSEWPPVYRPSKEKKGGPKDVIPMACVAGALGAFLDGPECVSYLPREWTGQVKKSTTVKGAKKSPRAQKVLRRLSGDELAVWDKVKYHDTIDAIGIGLHYLGRFDRMRVIARS